MSRPEEYFLVFANSDYTLDLARFIRTVLARLKLARTTLILTSDHGNIEDLSIRNHTLNHVPTLAWGAGREHVRGRVRSLADITPVIIELLVRED